MFKSVPNSFVLVAMNALWWRDGVCFF